MNSTNPKVDWFFDKPGKWQEEYAKLRAIVMDCGLTEELKWGCPCYTLAVPGGKRSNVVLIHGFKEYCALLFFKGALIKDADGILIRQTENVQSSHQARFTSAKEIVKLKATLKAYVFEAVEVEKAGLKVKLKKISEYPIPEEFKHELNKKPALKTAFKALTPGRQRQYLFHFSEARQAKTRLARIEKYIPQILKGKGLND